MKPKKSSKYPLPSEGELDQARAEFPIEVWDECTYQEKERVREEFAFWFDKWFESKEPPFKSQSPIVAYNKYLNPSRRDNHGIPGTD